MREQENPDAYELAGFKNLAEGYVKFIEGIDLSNGIIDAQIKEHLDSIAKLQSDKKKNLRDRESRKRKLAGVRKLIRDVEDAQIARARLEEDSQE